MAPLDATSCWVLGQTASQQRRSFCHLQVVGGGTRHQPSVGHHKRWRVSIPVIHWFVQVCRGWERVLAQRIPFIFDFAMYIEIKDEISHSVQRFSVKEMWKCLAPFQRSPTATASCLCWGRSCGDELASGHQAPNLWEIVNTDYLNITLQANYVHGTISLCTMYSTVICMYL